MDADSKKTVYNYQGDKYFVPASNTKIMMCYAALKYLGDSVPALRYTEDATTIYVTPTGDPTLLSPDFKQQPVLDFFARTNKKIVLNAANWKEKQFGIGWSWDDYEADYMPERSPMPIYANIASFNQRSVVPALFQDSVSYGNTGLFGLARQRTRNQYYAVPGNRAFKTADIPFVTDGIQTTLAILNQQLPGKFSVQATVPQGTATLLHSQPLDSLLKITMHRSDNFFAEQTLLMVSNEKLGVLSDARIIDTLLKTDFADLPQHPKWVDGSGLSRYNLITPQDFATVLYKIKQSFGWNRITTIFPTGNSGTLGGYYKNMQGAIFAKTGTLSNNLALSGYLVTRKHKTLIFSIIVNNHMAGASAIRREIEAFLTDLYERG